MCCVTISGQVMRGHGAKSKISLTTLEQSINLCNYFTEQRRILDYVSEFITNGPLTIKTNKLSLQERRD